MKFIAAIYVSAAFLTLAAASSLRHREGETNVQRRQAVEAESLTEQAKTDAYYRTILDAQKAELEKIQSLFGEQDPTKFPEMPKLEFKPLHSGNAMLVPTLAMLQGLYDNGKERIADLNVKEKQSKAFFDEKEKENDGRVSEIEAKFSAGKLSKEFHEDELHERKRMFTYWQRVRERQHRQYLSALRLQHATMKKVSKLIDLYNKAISGNAEDQLVAQRELSKLDGGSLVLLETAWKAVPCCNDELDALRLERSKLNF